MAKQSCETIQLPRGGFLVETPIGKIQFGSPPETIKDTMLSKGGVPQLFVLPGHFFNWTKGISVAEVEFPIYYNFFIKNRKTTIICQKDQAQRFICALKESLFGPEDLDLTKDFPKGTAKEMIPDLKTEVGFFRNNLELDQLVEFVLFKDKTAKWENLTVTIQDNDDFDVYYNNDFLASVPSDIEYRPKYDIGQRLAEPYLPPLFGMTCLGPSHGFDPQENTSGYILWINGRGIMIDPPVNSTEWLEKSNVSPKLIDSIILTHCHADHDAGTLQKILEESKITVYTTKTVMNSFIRKYASLTNSPQKYLRKLFEFIPVTIGEPFFIHGGKFSFFYTLHSIPTTGFLINYGKASLIYTSDHNNDPTLHKKLHDERILSDRRFKEFNDFPWDETNLIYHEGGIPPLHTPIAYLNSLNPEIQKKVVVYHIAKKDFPEETNLNLARFGIENTITVDVETPDYLDSFQKLNLLHYLDFFQNTPLSKAKDFITMVKEEHFKKDDYIIRKGTPGKKFYIIKSGNINVLGDNLSVQKIYGTYDYFGEVALITEQKRTADIIAATDVAVYTLDKAAFLHFISGTTFETALRRLAVVRDSESWNILSKSPFFRILSSTQKTVLESMLYKANSLKPFVLLKEGSEIKRCYIIRQGEVEVWKGQTQVSTLHKGDFVGAMVKAYRNEPAVFTFKTTGPVNLYYVDKEDVIRFLDQNPGLTMKLVYDFLEI